MIPKHLKVAAAPVLHPLIRVVNKSGRRLPIHVITRDLPYHYPLYRFARRQGVLGGHLYYGTCASQSDFPRLAGGTIPFIRKYSTICP